MDILTLKQEILNGKIFIYPTDTIYGIGCNALNKDSVDKIRQIKRRDNKPFSVIAPSFEWIEEVCEFRSDLSQYLPGPFTVILTKKEADFLNWVSDKETLGIRIPDYDFTRQVQLAGVPFITTSVNFSGQTPALNIAGIPKEILDQVDYVIDEGELNGKPSTIINISDF